jgi:hypothetical protein
LAVFGFFLRALSSGGGGGLQSPGPLRESLVYSYCNYLTAVADLGNAEIVVATKRSTEFKVGSTHSADPVLYYAIKLLRKSLDDLMLFYVGTHLILFYCELGRL